jgi:hypothetical protein
MPTSPALRRLLLVLALLPSVLIALYAWRQAKEEQIAVNYYVDSYDQIAVGMPEDRVDELLGWKGREVADLGWAKVLGELPGHWREILKSRPLRWKKWGNLPGPDRWIAVAFMVEGGSDCYPRVVAKKKGSS